MMQIPLLSSVHPGLVALIDDEDFDLVRGYVWHPLILKNSATPYAIRYFEASGKELMHRRILGLSYKDGLVSDHIDHNGLNNQRANLRICSIGENSRNRKMSSHNIVGLKGVHTDNTRSPPRYRAVVTHEKKIHRFPWVKNPQVAREMYLQKSRELHGEFAYE